MLPSRSMLRKKISLPLRLPLLTALPLAAGCGLFAGPNWMTSKGDLPFPLGKVESALWIGDVESYGGDEVYGRGDLLLIDREVDCEEVLGENFNGADSPIWKSSGILAEFRYNAYARGDATIDESDYSFEGEYWSGVDMDNENPSVNESRYWWGGVFAEGNFLQVYENKGFAEITDHSKKTVSGRLDTNLYKARFEAENCGAPEPDSYYYYDSGWGRR